jgi:2-(1,2-epoxy-1,2-dihydrophenyl)acetyl-CoA isomerase
MAAGRGVAVSKADDLVITEVVDRSTVITLNRPERRNALTFEMMAQVTSAIELAGGDESCHAIVLTGNGAFCAGIDLESLSSHSTDDVEVRGTTIYDLPQSMVRALVSVPVPTIAALDGPAVGLGMDLALACDMRLVGADGWMMQGWARAGLVPATGGVFFMERLAPGVLWRAIDGHPRLHASHLMALNLAESVDGSALDAARARANAYGGMSRLAMESYVRLSRSTYADQLDAHLRAAAEMQLTLFQAGKYRERAVELHDDISQRGAGRPRPNA